MKEVSKEREKRCPVCKNEYPEEDNYCGEDGSFLEEARAPIDRHDPPLAGTPMRADDVNANFP